jgi:hypothetical protein
MNEGLIFRLSLRAGADDGSSGGGRDIALAVE